MIAALSKVKGLIHSRPLSDEDRQRVLDIEQEAEKKSLMGLGNVINTGVREVLTCDLIYVALTNMNFEWSCRSTLILKKGQELAGEEIRDQKAITELSKRQDVWFMLDNFVIYKDKIAFPDDIINKVCYFETPCFPAEWCIVEDDKFRCQSIIFANPVTPCDLFLKKKYFITMEEKGLGTILVGVKW